MLSSTHYFNNSVFTNKTTKIIPTFVLPFPTVDLISYFPFLAKRRTTLETPEELLSLHTIEGGQGVSFRPSSRPTTVFSVTTSDDNERPI